MFACGPEVVAVTFTLTVHEPLAGIVPPLNASDVGAGVRIARVERIDAEVGEAGVVQARSDRERPEALPRVLARDRGGVAEDRSAGLSRGRSLLCTVEQGETGRTVRRFLESIEVQ